MKKRILNLDPSIRPGAHKSEFPSHLRLNIDDAASSAELFIYGEIGGWWGDGPDTEQTIKDLSQLDVNELVVRVNSPGGVVFDGVAIYNAIANHKANVIVHVEGIAASIASVIAMAGDKIMIGEAANIMIHKPWSFVVGDSSTMRKEADVLDTLEGGLVDIYAARTGAKREDIASWLEAETWFRGQAAVDSGFADEVIPAKTKKSNAARSTVYAMFRNAPADLLASIERDEPPVRRIERALIESGVPKDAAKRAACLAAKEIAVERDAPANVQRDVVRPEPIADADNFRLANHLRKLSR